MGSDILYSFTNILNNHLHSRSICISAGEIKQAGREYIHLLNLFRHQEHLDVYQIEKHPGKMIINNICSVNTQICLL